jgi:nucleolar pre-ribosomal-associated protein 1
MPSKPHNTAEPPKKRPRLVPNAKTLPKFTHAHEIRAGLRNQNQDGLTESISSPSSEFIPLLTALAALLALRNQFTIQWDESLISPLDERLLLAKKWLDSDPGAHDIFDIWENANQVCNCSIGL